MAVIVLALLMSPWHNKEIWQLFQNRVAEKQYVFLCKNKKNKTKQNKKEKKHSLFQLATVFEHGSAIVADLNDRAKNFPGNELTTPISQWFCIDLQTTLFGDPCEA